MFKIAISCLALVLFTGCAMRGRAIRPLGLGVDAVSHDDKLINFEFKAHKATVFIFLSSVCPCSNSNSFEVLKLAKKYSRIKFVGVHSNADETKIQGLKYFSNSKFNYEIIYDKDSVIAKRLGALKTPHVFVVNSNGEVIYTGGVTNSSNAKLAKEFYLENALSDIMNDKKPRAPRKKTLGCYIKLKS